jgi:hypothetical protein
MAILCGVAQKAASAAQYFYIKKAKRSHKTVEIKVYLTIFV